MNYRGSRPVSGSAISTDGGVDDYDSGYGNN
jgi:hypothetical protein